MENQRATSESPILRQRQASRQVPAMQPQPTRATRYPSNIPAPTRQPAILRTDPGAKRPAIHRWTRQKTQPATVPPRPRPISPHRAGPPPATMPPPLRTSWPATTFQTLRWSISPAARWSASGRWYPARRRCCSGSGRRFDSPARRKLRPSSSSLGTIPPDSPWSASAVRGTSTSLNDSSTTPASRSRCSGAIRSQRGATTRS